ncbi:hypothetical protein RFI_08708 [Reticulomyxa filosa]|uniref:Uncharacterized protein n=1 Tax=Reticulomyxa filosa TaxID=46433 RepID=X6NRU7_RETFI|nr:hypothetical protein RFI_08708 [Reticulomyxa filosa]|eukprot:ETO28424.1 hypothetical protein RFI_08708 [Reticulomyxa filosa]
MKGFGSRESIKSEKVLDTNDYTMLHTATRITIVALIALISSEFWYLVWILRRYADNIVFYYLDALWNVDTVINVLCVLASLKIGLIPYQFICGYGQESKQYHTCCRFGLHTFCVYAMFFGFVFSFSFARRLLCFFNFFFFWHDSIKKQSKLTLFCIKKKSQFSHQFGCKFQNDFSLKKICGRGGGGNMKEKNIVGYVFAQLLQLELLYLFRKFEQGAKTTLSPIFN